MESMFQKACDNGDVSKAQALFKTLPTISYLGEFFRLSCYKGHVEMAQWFFHLNDSLDFCDDIRTDLDVSFTLACIKGHLDVARWLISLGDVSKDTGTYGGPIDIHAKEDEAFRWACRYGRLHIAQWLIDLSKDTETYGGPIDIHAKEDEAFRWACENGHLHVAQLLIPFGGMPVMELGEDHPIRKFYLDRFPTIGLLSFHFRRYLRDFRERMYLPGGKGYEFAKKRFEMAV